MSIRTWFGVEVNYENSPFNQCLDKFLSLYSSAINTYFGFEDSDSLKDLISHLNICKLPVSQRLFVDWITRIGIKEMKELASITETTINDSIALIEYEYYILNEEMNFEYPDDVRSIIIGTAKDLSTQLKERD